MILTMPAQTHKSLILLKHKKKLIFKYIIRMEYFPQNLILFDVYCKIVYTHLCIVFTGAGSRIYVTWLGSGTTVTHCTTVWIALR